MRWFRRRLWRLKWLQLMVINIIVAIVISRDSTRAADMPHPLVIVALSPILAWFWWFAFALWGRMCYMMPLTAWIPGRVKYLNDRILSQFCDEQMFFLHRY
jgi:hypothetical protein